MKIRRATPRDVPRLAPLFDAYRRFYGKKADLPGARRFLKARLSRRESVVFIAAARGEFLGFTQLYPTFSSTAMKRLWILNDLFVAPEARGRGVARALMRRAEKLARETRAEGLMLETAVTNKTAQRLYEGMGWKKDVEFFRYYRDF